MGPMNDASSVIPSAEALSAEYAERVNITRREVLVEVNEFIKKVDVDALCNSASNDMGSKCTNAYLIATGGFNAIYLLTFLDGREAIARLNREEQTSDQILLRDRVLSEASTLRYVNQYCSVPVPTVFIVNAHLPNSIGARYIIEERVLGRQWVQSRCTPAERKVIFTKIFQYEAEFIRTRFTSIGSIYHRKEDNTFYVGPMGPTVCFPLNHTVDRGPWTTSRDWLKAYIKSELADIHHDTEGYRKEREGHRLTSDNATFAYHVAWLETLLATVDELQYLRDIPAAVERPVLLHEDLDDGNILISYTEPTEVAGLVDFEGAKVVPLWSAMAYPKCINNIFDPVEAESMRKIRLEILCEADPACAQAASYRHALRHLKWLACTRITRGSSIEELHRDYEELKGEWPVQEPALTALDNLVAMGPAGHFAKHGNV